MAFVLPIRVSMKLTVLDQYAKGLVHRGAELGEEIREQIARLKWALWHGNLYKALSKIEDLESLIYNFEETYPKFTQLRKAVKSSTPTSGTMRSSSRTTVNGIATVRRSPRVSWNRP